jgi:hypothetical protein
MGDGGLILLVPGRRVYRKISGIQMIRAGDVGRSSGGSDKLPFNEVQYEETGNEQTTDAVQRETQR